jgi:hypothetical protein
MTTDWYVRIAVWSLTAFWLWLALTVVLRGLRIPFALATAAALGWIGAGLSLGWLLPLVEEWMARWFHLPRGLLTMR